jgi:hypothetical protein
MSIIIFKLINKKLTKRVICAILHMLKYPKIVLVIFYCKKQLFIKKLYTYSKIHGMDGEQFTTQIIYCTIY